MAEQYDAMLGFAVNMDTRVAERRLDKLERKLTEATSSMEKSAGADMRKAMSEMLSSAEKMTPAMEKVVQEIEKQSAQLDKVVGKNDDAIAKVEDYRLKHMKATEAVDAQLKKVQELNSAIDKITSGDVTPKSVQNLQTSLEKSYAEQAKITEKSQREIAVLEKELAKFKTASDKEATQKIASLQKDAEATDKALQDSEKELERLGVKYEELTQQRLKYEAAQQELRSFDTQLAELRNASGELERQRDILQEIISKYNEEEAAIEKRYITLTKEEVLGIAQHKDVSEITKELDALEAKLEEIDKKRAPFLSESEGLENKISAYTEQITDIRRMYDKNAQISFDYDEQKNLSNTIDNLIDKANALESTYKEINAEIENIKQSNQAAVEQQTANTEEQIQTIINRTKYAISDATAEQERLRSEIFNMKVNPDLIPEVQQYRQELTEATAKTERLNAERANLATGAERTLTQNTAELNTEYERIYTNMNNLLVTLYQLIQAQQHEAAQQEELASKSEETSEATRTTERNTRKTANNVDVTSRIMKSLVGHARQLSRSLKGVYNNIRGTVDRFNVLGHAVSKIGKRIIRMFRRVFLFSVITKYLRALRAAVGNILKNNEELANSFGRIRANMLTAFAPLYEYALPIIKVLVNALANAAQRLAQLTSSIFGKTIQQAQESAKALLAQAKATDKTADSTSKLNKQLGHLDELNQDVSTESENASDSSDEDDDKWVWELRELEKLDFYKLGRQFGALIQKLNNVPWKTIKETAQEWGTNLALFLNGAISPETFMAIGNALAEFKNIKWSFFKGFIDEFDANNLGNSIVAGVKKYLDTIDWKLIRGTVRTAFKKLADMLNIIVSDKELWKKIGENIANKLLTIIDGWWSFVSNFKFAEFGNSVGQAIKTFFDKMSTVEEDGMNGWQRLGKSITETVGGILDFLLALLDAIDWQEVGQALADFIGSIDWGRIIISIGNLAVKLAEAIGSALMALGAENPIAAGIISAILIGMTASKLAPVVKALGIGLKSSAAASAASGAAGAAASGGAVATLGTVLAEGAVVAAGSIIGSDLVAHGIGAITGDDAYKDFSWFGKDGLIETIASGNSWSEFLGGITGESIDTEESLKREKNLYEYRLEVGAKKIKKFIHENGNMLLASSKTWEKHIDLIEEYAKVTGVSWDEAKKAVDEALKEEGVNVEVFVESAKIHSEELRKSWTDMWDEVDEKTTSTLKSMAEKYAEEHGFEDENKKKVDGIRAAFKELFGEDQPNSIGDLVKKGVDGITSIINGDTTLKEAFGKLGAAAGAMFSANLATNMNGIIEELNGTEYELPGGVKQTFTRMDKLGIPQPTLKNVSVPWGAHGMVVPASSRAFLAGLGDNNHETEVVSPLSTMKEALLEALDAHGTGEQQITLQIDGDELFRWIVQKNKETYLQTRQNMLVY